MTSNVIPFPGKRVIRRTEDRLRVILDGVHDYWSLRDFTRLFIRHQLEMDMVERTILSRDMHRLWQVYPPESRTNYAMPRHAV